MRGRWEGGLESLREGTVEEPQRGTRESLPWDDWKGRGHFACERETDVVSPLYSDITGTWSEVPTPREREAKALNGDQRQRSHVRRQESMSERMKEAKQSTRRRGLAGSAASRCGHSGPTLRLAWTRLNDIVMGLPRIGRLFSSPLF